MKNNHNFWLIVCAAGCLSAGSALPFNFGPVIFGSAADQFGFTPENIGYFSSLFLLGFSSSIIGLYFLQTRVNWHYVMVIGTVVGGVLMWLSSLTGNVMYWNVLWLLIGLSFGPVFSIVVPVLAKLPNAARGFGGKLALETGIPALMLLVFPILIVSNWGYSGVAVGSLVVLIALSLTAKWIPKDLAQPEPIPEDVAGSGGGLDRGRAVLTWIGILAVCIYFGGQISTWIFVERSARTLDYGNEAIGILLFLGKSGAMVGSITAAVIASTFGRWKPHLMSFVIICTGQFLLLTHPTYFLFMTGAFFFEFAWAFLVPYLMTHVGELDQTKKLVVFVPAAMAMGGAYGPALAGNIVTETDYSNVFVFGLITATVCFAVYSWLTQRLNVMHVPEAPVEVTGEQL
jgi:predicted MFS family arabinose efflux permease